MKRRLVTVLVFLLLGAIVNVSVAWGGQVPYQTQPFPPDTEIDAKRCQEIWRDIAPLDWPPATNLFGSQYANLTWVRQRVVTGDYPPGFEVERVTCGWPCLAMQGSSAAGQSGGGDDDVGTLHIGYYRSVVLPHRTLWPGFAINTVFYAGILWLLFAAPFSLRRRSRIKRGLCPKCAYPIGTNTVCTECGTSVSTWSKRLE